jgi:hypothetical protein
MQPMTLLKRRGETSPAVLVFLALLVITGCRDASDVTEPVRRAPATPTTPTTPPSPTASGPLLVSGGMSPEHQAILVSRAGAAVTDAEVTVNGFPIPHCCGNLYSGNLPKAVRAGDTLYLKVTAGDVTFEGFGEVMATPVITSPTAGSTFASTDSITMAWSTPTDPDRFQVCLNCRENALEAAIYHASGSAREYTIEPGILVDYGAGAVVAVYAFKSNFLKAESSPAVSSDVGFVARSRDVVITLKD